MDGGWGDLDAAERLALRRTRQEQLAEARNRLEDMSAASSPPVQPVDAPPLLPCQPLALVPYRGRPQAPVAPALRADRPAKITWTVAAAKVLTVIVIACVIYPPFAEIPGRIVGFTLRAVATQCPLAANHFWSSMISELQGVFADTLQWLENAVWPVGESTSAPPAGARLTALVAGLFSLRVLRQAW